MSVLSGGFTIEPLAKPLEMLQASVAVTEKYGSGAHVPGKARGFAIRAC